MKKKFMSLVAVGCAGLLQQGYAGDMGAVDAAVTHQFTPFVSAEGFPVWIKFGGISLTDNSGTSTADQGSFLSGGARGAAGVSYSYTDRVDFTAETGWNYFGTTSGTVRGTEFGARVTGADLFVGAAYKTRNMDYFVKAGTVFERAHFKINMPRTFVITIDPTSYYATVNAKLSISDFLPTIKVGTNYRYNSNWSLSAAYMHAFGETPKLDASSLQSGTTVTNLYTGTNLRCPTLDAIMFGLRYNFV